MKLLLENWRRYLNEAAKGPQDFIGMSDVIIRVVDHGEGIAIRYDSQRGEQSNKPWGEIVIERNPEGAPSGPCDGAFMVTHSEAKHGWGPLLYDIAMEYATMKGGGLFADRADISAEARDVWRYYFNKRPDVAPHQLDNLDNELTPDIQVDNCDQSTAEVDWEGMETDWVRSPISKRYTKAPTTIDALRNSGKLIIE
tara:strand:- start:78 stop:668 length:591 start_codon:yes stop_codon:yes gene_type:complete